jgi:hypothetical protein
MEVGVKLRTTTAGLSAPPRSTTATSEQSFTLDNRRGAIWGSRVASSNLASPTR